MPGPVEPYWADIIEPLASDAWPAAEVRNLSGWHLRYTPDTTIRRCNSVLATVFDDDHQNPNAIKTVIENVEKFYKTRHCLPRFQLSAASTPVQLDQILADLDYKVEAPTMVMSRTFDDLKIDQRVINPVALSTVVDENWLDCYMDDIPDARERRSRMSIITRNNKKPIFASIVKDNKTIACGMMAIKNGYGGIFCMHTRRAFRSQGWGSEIITAFIQHGLRQPINHFYLQVETDNIKGQRFYKKFGFQTRYLYHYRTHF